MSADSFHKSIEDAMRRMNEVCDWDDFVTCVNEAGKSIEMRIDDFYAFENGLSNCQASKNSKPRLDEVVVSQFRKGLNNCFFKKVIKMSILRNMSFYFS